MRLLLIEDDTLFAASLTDILRQQYAVDWVGSGSTGLFKASVNEYDLCILDLGLPDQDGVEVCRQLRTKNASLPILVLTAQDAIDMKVAVLDAGADDYLTKPFLRDELTARLRALSRRTAPRYAPVLHAAALDLDTASRQVSYAGNPIPLRRKEYELLELFLRNPGRTLTRSQITEHIWDEAVNHTSNTIDVHVKHLRDKIERPYGCKLIQTVSGIGYRFCVSTSN